MFQINIDDDDNDDNVDHINNNENNNNEIEDGIKNEYKKAVKGEKNIELWMNPLFTQYIRWLF